MNFPLSPGKDSFVTHTAPNILPQQTRDWLISGGYRLQVERDRTDGWMDCLDHVVDANKMIDRTSHYSEGVEWCRRKQAEVAARGGKA